MSDWQEAYFAAQAEIVQAKIAGILNAKPTLVESEEAHEFTIEPFTHEGVRYTRVKVSRIRYFEPREDDTDDDYLQVRALGQKTTKTGAPSKRDTPFWYSMPDDLCEPLIRHAARQAEDHLRT
jgi:hypothetical protein